MLLGPIEILYRKWMKILNILFTKYDHECVAVFFKFYKNQTMSENYEICQDLLISYVEVVVKTWKISDILSHKLLTKRNVSEEES